MSVFNYSSHREFIENSMLEAKKRNPSFSLRAFADKLGISASHLSAVLLGNRTFSPEMALAICEKMNLSQIESDYFIKLVYLDAIKDPKAKERWQKKLLSKSFQRDAKQFSPTGLEGITEWFYIPILVLAGREDFKVTPASIAMILGIKISIAARAIQTLSEKNLLVPDPTHGWIRTSTNLIFSSDSKSNSLREFHRQMLKKAMESIDTQLPQEKFIGSETLLFAQESLAEFRDLTEKYLEQVYSLAKTRKTGGDLYHLNLQFFRLNVDHAAVDFS